MAKLTMLFTFSHFLVHSLHYCYYSLLRFYLCMRAAYSLCYFKDGIKRLISKHVLIVTIYTSHRKTEALAADIELVNSKLQNAIEANKKWKEDTKLNLKTALSPTSNIQKLLTEADKATIEVLVRTVDTKRSVGSKENRNVFAKLENSLQRVEEELVKAEISGKRAGELFLAAKSFGDRESAAYLKQGGEGSSSVRSPNLPKTLLVKIK